MTSIQRLRRVILTWALCNGTTLEVIAAGPRCLRYGSVLSFSHYFLRPRRVAKKRPLGGHHTMLEPLGAAPSVNSAIMAQKFNENQLEYLIRRTSYQVHDQNVHARGTRRGPARHACGAGPRAGPRARAPPDTFHIIGILTGSEDSRIDFMQKSEF